MLSIIKSFVINMLNIFDIPVPYTRFKLILFLNITEMNSLFTKSKSFPLMTKWDKIRHKCEKQLIK